MTKRSLWGIFWPLDMSDQYSDTEIGEQERIQPDMPFASI
jgi:hypothetical protein